MGLIDQIVNVNITATQATPSLPGTNIPALHGYHTHNTDAIRTYFDPDGMLSDGYSSTEALYKMALRLASQNPRPSLFKVIRGTTSVQQTFTFLVTNNNNGANVGLSITSPAGVKTDMFVTVASQTTAQIATALAALVPAGVTAAAVGSTVTFTVTASGAVWFPSAMFGGTFTDTTPSNSPQTDLAAAALVDSNFYGVASSLWSSANIAAAAAWTEANSRLHVYTSADDANLIASTGVFSTLKASAYNRSAGLFSRTLGDYAGVGWMAQRFTADPGSDTWAFKTIQGAAVDNLTAAQIAAATPLGGNAANNGNVYVPVGGVNWTLEGVCASGLYIDIQRGIDGLSRDMQSRVLTLLGRLPKLPYTRKGIAMVGAEVGASLQAYQTIGFLSEDVGFTPVIQLPDVGAVAPTDKSNRVLRNVKWQAVAQGAVQTVLIQGNISF